MRRQFRQYEGGGDGGTVGSPGDTVGCAEHRPLGTCVLVGVPLPGKNEAVVPADLARPILRTAQLAETDFPNEYQNPMFRCRVEVADDLMGWLRMPSAVDENGIPDRRRLNGVIEGTESGDDLMELRRRGQMVRDVSQRIRDQLGLARVDVRGFTDTLRNMDDRQVILTVIEAAEKAFGDDFIIDGVRATLRDHIDKLLIPGHVFPKNGGGIVPGDRYYAYVEFQRIMRKVARDVAVYAYEREKGLRPLLEAWLIQRDGMSQEQAAAKLDTYLRVTADIEGFRLLRRPDKNGSQTSNGNNGESRMQFAPPYVAGTGRVPLYPNSEADPTDFYARHLEPYGDTGIRYAKKVIVPVLRRMREAAPGNPKISDALYGTSIGGSINGILDAVSVDDQEAQNRSLRLNLRDILTVYLGAFVRPINKAMDRAAGK